MLDRTKLIKGYHYGYVHALANTDKYVDQPMDLHLFTINDVTRKRYWLGVIRNLIPVSRKKSEKVFNIYKKKDWFSEMKWQVKIAGGEVGQFKEIPEESFFNLKFKPADLELLDSPRQFSAQDSAVKATRYGNYLTGVRIRKLSLIEAVSTSHLVTIRGKVNETRITTSARRETVLMHNRMQNHIYKQLKKEYGEKNVGTENETATGARIDVVVRDDKKYDLYEIKIRNDVRISIREALSQLIEYAYWPGKGNKVNRLIIVAPRKTWKRREGLPEVSTRNVPHSHLLHDLRRKRKTYYRSGIKEERNVRYRKRTTCHTGC